MSDVRFELVNKIKSRVARKMFTSEYQTYTFKTCDRSFKNAETRKSAGKFYFIFQIILKHFWSLIFKRLEDIYLASCKCPLFETKKCSTLYTGKTPKIGDGYRTRNKIFFRAFFRICFRSDTNSKIISVTCPNTGNKQKLTDAIVF